MPNKRSGGGLSPTQQAAKFLGVSVLAGAVLAGIALPAVGALGLAAKGSVESFDELPANMKTPPLSQRTTILDADGGQIATVYSRDRTVVPLKDVSPYMQKAIVAIEDSRFYQHGAVDLKGVLRALNKNAQTGGVSEGASTLTQQYVKNVFVEEAGDDPTKVAQATQQTIGRKIRELKYAIQVEEELGKKKILENYLNITFFGQQAYGVEAAAQRYFSKSAKDLNVQEAALLAGIVQSPSRYDPVNDEAEATKRRNTVLRRMAAVGDISRAQAADAMKAPLGLKVSKPKNGCITAVKGAGFFCDYVREVFLTDPVFGKTKEKRAKIWNQGGLTIRTTMDPQSQNAAQRSIKDHVYKSDEVATAASIVQPGTGKILAMGQSRPYGFKKNETQINLSVDQSMGGGMGYQPGSTFKPIVAAAALEDGMPANKVYSSPYRMAYPSPVSACDDDGEEDGRRAGRRRQDAAGALHRPRHPGDVPADHGERVRDLRLARHALHADRHRVGQPAGRRQDHVARGSQVDLLARDVGEHRRHHQHAAEGRRRGRYGHEGGPRQPSQRRQDRYDGRALRGLVRGLHAEHGRCGLGRRPRAQAEDVRHHHRRPVVRQGLRWRGPRSDLARHDVRRAGGQARRELQHRPHPRQQAPGPR